MRKLVLGIGLGAFIVFSASAGALTAYKADDTAGVAVTVPAAAHGEQERADLAQSYTAGTVPAAAHGDQERADMAQPYAAETVSADTERLLCDGDICLVP